MVDALNILPEEIGARGIPKVYNRDNIMHHQDEAFKHVAYIQTGRAFGVSVNIDGEETWLTEYTAGQFMGCEGMFGDTRPDYHIVAKTPLTALLFPMGTFMELMQSHKGLCAMVTADLSRQIRKLTTYKLEANSFSMRGRIAAELARLARPIGKTPDTFIIRPTPVFSEFALRLGSSRETVSRTVSALVGKNVLTRKTGALLVHDLDKLKAEIR